MKTIRLLNSPVALGLLLVPATALLIRLHPTALAEGPNQRSTKRDSPQAAGGAAPVSPAETQPQRSTAGASALVPKTEAKPAQGKHEQPAAPDNEAKGATPEEYDWRNNMQNVPEEAKRAITELKRAGLHVLLRQDQEDEKEESTKGGNREDKKETSRVMVTISMSGASPNKPGFEAGFTRTALGKLLRGLPNVYAIDLSHTNLSDQHLEQVGKSEGLTTLHLCSTPISDTGLAHIAALKDLQALSLDNTLIGDSGLVHLRGMKNLSSLGLGGTKFTDAGLENLEQMNALEQLWLDNTNISDAGLAHLRGLSLEELWLDGTRITDAGLVHFKEGMRQLQHLHLMDTKVTKAGIDELMRDVPNLQNRTKGNVTTIAIDWGSTVDGN